MVPALHVILIGLCAHTASSLLKCKTNRSWKAYFTDGGKPSAHSATVTSIACGIYLLEGLTNTFVLALIFAWITIHDAVHVRGEVGKHARALNKLDKKNHLTEKIGHTWKEALEGVMTGLVVAVLYKIIFL